MPDLWNSGPSLPPPSGPQQNVPDHSAPDSQSQAADGGVQHIDGVAYRTGAVAAGEAPFSFEQVGRHLDGKLAGLYGAEAVPAVREALRGAVAAEGLGAYDRFGTDPGAFGDVRGGATRADGLGRALREVEVYRAYCVEHGHLVPAEPVADRTLTREPEPGWLTPRDAEIAHETREALTERRVELVRDVERRHGDRRAEAEQMLQSVDRSIETLDLIGARQDLAFTFRNADPGSDRGTTGVRPERGVDGRPVIEIRIAGDRNSRAAANRVHELYHAGEFARGRVFVREGVGRQLEGAAVDSYSGNEEVAAYRAQYAFDRGSLVRSSYGDHLSSASSDRAPRNLGEVNRADVKGLERQDEEGRNSRGQSRQPFYSGLQWAP